MRSPEPYASHPPVRRWRGVCVLALLAGLFAMHGLAPGGGLPGHPSRHLPAHSAPADTAAYAGCLQDAGSCGGHLRHADGACASAAVSDGPVLPVLAPDPVPAVAGDRTVCAHAADAPDGARAPPSLAELQLLRI